MLLLVCHMIQQDQVNKGSCDFMSYHSARFGGHRHCGNRYIMILIGHVLFQDHIIKASCQGKSRESLKVSHHSPKFGDHYHYISGDDFSWFQFATWSCKTTQFMSFYGQEPINVNYYPAKSGGYRQCVTGSCKTTGQKGHVVKQHSASLAIKGIVVVEICFLWLKCKTYMACFKSAINANF